MQSQLSLQFLFGIKWLHCATLHFVNLITCSLPQCSKSTVGNLLHLDSFTCDAILLHSNLDNYSAAFIEKIFCSALWAIPDTDLTYVVRPLVRVDQDPGKEYQWILNNQIAFVTYCKSSPVEWIVIHKEIHAVTAWKKKQFCGRRHFWSRFSCITSPLAINLAEGGVVGDVVLAGGLQLPGLLRLLAPLIELVALAHSAQHNQGHKAGLSSNVIHFSWLISTT